MSLKRERSTPIPVPFLLNEFPVPPTFIPHHVQTATNPPPSRPPTLPLPPIPGPSPLSEQDLVHFSAAARSRRGSRISTHSNASSWRESVASVGSASSGPSSVNHPISAALTSQPPGRHRTESATSISTHSAGSHSPTNSSHPLPLSSYPNVRASKPDSRRSPPVSVAMNPAILEDDESLPADITGPSLTRTSLPNVPSANPSPLPRLSDEPALHGERLSSIDMHDLPALQDDDTTDLDSQAHSLYLQMRATGSKNSMHKSRFRQAMPLPHSNGISSVDEAHKRTSSATQHSWNRGSLHDTNLAPMAFPGIPLPVGSDRASSPDVASCMAATPRPRRRSETSSTGSRSRSLPRRRVPKSLPGSRRTSAAGRLSVFSLPDEATRQGSATLASRSLLPYSHNPDDGDGLWDEGSLIDDYGVVIGDSDGFPNVPDQDDAADESDSSLDLHTPLPSLMLRDGLLSPHSKLLPQNIRSDLPVVATDGSRHGSVVSNSATKSGVFKDERDTTRRRVRHRDGRLLRGGIGLTTGLGWSDSEDEDAPSPLTRRLSHLALSRQSSAASIRTIPRTSRSHPHPLSRSFSGDAKVYSSKSNQNLRRPSVPPTSWQNRSRTVSSKLSLSIPEQDTTESAASEPPSSRVDIQVDSQRNDQVRTPSSSSSQSLPGPITPDVMDIPHSLHTKSWDRDKNLPPLPLSRGPSIANLRPMESLSDVKSRPPKPESHPSMRPISSGSELSDSPAVCPRTPRLPRASMLSSTRTTPRPLQLSASLGTGLQPGEPASMQGLLLSYNRQLHDQQRARTPSVPSFALAEHRLTSSMRPLGSVATPALSRSGSVDLSLSELGELRLRPRTGTGMVYRKSSTNLTRAAADVQAQSRIRMTSERASQVAL